MNVRVNSFRSPQGGHIGTGQALRFADLGAAVGCKNAFCMCLRNRPDWIPLGTWTSARDRRTAETHMAALGISSDVRAQIQSHGLGGIQARHYDRHDYMPEKRAALELWSRRFRNLPLVPRRTAGQVRSRRVRERGAIEQSVSAS